MKLTVGMLMQAVKGLPDDTPIVFAESVLVGQAPLAPIGDVDEIDATLSYSWDGTDLDEAGTFGEPAVVIWWKDEA